MEHNHADSIESKTQTTIIDSKLDLKNTIKSKLDSKANKDFKRY